MKPPTKDWSSEHQSPSCKSSLFQTSEVLIQTPPRGELLVRNQYSSCGGTLTHPLYKDPWSLKKYLLVKGLKSLSAPSSTDMAGRASYATVQSSKWVQPPKVTFKDTSTCVRAAFTLKKTETETIKAAESALMFPIVVNGNMINNFTNSKFPFTQHTPGPAAPPPCPVTL